jgi:hypothetical protein
MEGLGFTLQKEAELETLTLDVLKSSEIEGERLDPKQVRSSIARRLGLDAGGTQPADRDVDGVVEMTLDATRNFVAPLTDERLFAWHAALFPGAARATRSASRSPLVPAPVLFRGRLRLQLVEPVHDQIDVRHRRSSPTACVCRCARLPPRQPI